MSGSECIYIISKIFDSLSSLIDVNALQLFASTEKVVALTFTAVKFPSAIALKLPDPIARTFSSGMFINDRVVALAKQPFPMRI